MKFIKRNQYLSSLVSLTGTPDIKIITGIRRCGKSVLMQFFLDYLEESEPDANIIYINLQDLDFIDLKEYRQLHAYCMEHSAEDRRAEGYSLPMHDGHYPSSKKYSTEKRV